MNNHKCYNTITSHEANAANSHTSHSHRRLVKHFKNNALR